MTSLLLLTCEHGGHAVPPEYRHLFKGHEHLLPTHRGWDAGALTLGREMAAALDAPLFAATTTRLLVDLNRSVGNPDLHAEPTRDLPLAERRAIVAAYHRPHRDAVDGAVADAIARGDRVVHVASHSFTPALKGVVRTADAGFLYDPARPAELGFATAWLEALQARRPDLRLRRNYPYVGKGDGLTSWLRKRHAADRYIGLELELNQRFVEAGGRAWTKIRGDLIESLRTAWPLAWGDVPTRHRKAAGRK
jgi:predicted N-formylglutamate amidohydrolase